MGTSRGTDLNTRSARAAPALPARAVGCHCSRAADPASAQREGRGAGPRKREDAGPPCSRGSCPARDAWMWSSELPQPAWSFRGPHPANRLEIKNKLTPLPRNRWAHHCGATRASFRGPGDRQRVLASPRSAPPSEAAGLPASEAERWALLSPGTAPCPVAQQPCAVQGAVCSGGERGRQEGWRVQITFLTCCGARATARWVPGASSFL